VVTVSASASVTLPNDRMYAWLRAEAENSSAAAAAADVNSRMAKALARIKAVPGVKVSTTGYGTNQVYDKSRPGRWRVTQSLKVEGTEFIALAALAGKLQDEDGLLLSGISFSLSDEARKPAEDGVTQSAIKAWQQRAQNAAQGLGYTAWRAGRVNVQTSDAAPPYPMQMRAQSMAVESKAQPVSVEAGTTDVSVTVSGEAVLDAPRPAAR
jgi:predicted secreted protein